MSPKLAMPNLRSLKVRRDAEVAKGRVKNRPLLPLPRLELFHITIPPLSANYSS